MDRRFLTHGKSTRWLRGFWPVWRSSNAARWRGVTSNFPVYGGKWEAIWLVGTVCEWQPLTPSDRGSKPRLSPGPRKILELHSKTVALMRSRHFCVITCTDIRNRKVGTVRWVHSEAIETKKSPVGGKMNYPERFEKCSWIHRIMSSWIHCGSSRTRRRFCVDPGWKQPV